MISLQEKPRTVESMSWVRSCLITALVTDHSLSESRYPGRNSQGSVLALFVAILLLEACAAGINPAECGEHFSITTPQMTAVKG
jgi:hypothetical protein